jgi:putative oxidoreductase
MMKDIALLWLRLAGFGLAIAHGWAKISMLSSGNGGGFLAGVEALGFPMPLAFAWAAALTEFVGGLCVALGLGTRIAASFAAFTMFVAAFFRHHLFGHILVWIGISSPPADVVESWGNPERAATYMLIFGALVLMGGGKFSLARLAKRGD